MQASPRARRMRIIALSLLVVAGTVNYLDRSALSIGNAPIRADLHLSDTEMGLLLSVFEAAYGIAQIPAGLLVDRVGAHRALGASLLVWSAAQVASAFSSGLGGFAAARAALGVGESPMYLGGTKVCSNWFVRDRRAWPIGLFNASSALGPALAPPLLTALLVAFGWRTMFLAVGVLGALVGLAWVLLYRDPLQAGIGAEERAALLAQDQGAPPPTAGRLAPLLREPTSWGMALGFGGVIYLTWLYGTWLPDYLQRARHLSLAAAGLWTAVPQFCGFLGALSSGLFARLLIGRGATPLMGCKLPLIAGMVVTAACTAGAALVHGVGPAIALVSAALFAASLASSCGWSMAAIATGPDRVATLEAVQNVGGSIGGALAPLVTGAIVGATGSFTPALLLAAVVALLSALVYALLVRERAGLHGAAVAAT